MNMSLEGKRALVCGSTDGIGKSSAILMAKRGAEIIDARGASSAASAANGAVDHMRDWVMGTADDDWVSMGVPSDGSYEIPKGLVFSFPVTCENSDYQIVQGLDIDEFGKLKIDATQRELEEEKAALSNILD